MRRGMMTAVLVATAAGAAVVPAHATTVIFKSRVSY